MEIGSIKIDFNGLAMFITALTAAYTTIRGVQQRKKSREKRAAMEADREEMSPPKKEGDGHDTNAD